MIDYNMSLKEYQQKKRLALKLCCKTGDCNGIACSSCPIVGDTPYANCYALEEQEPLLAIKIVSEIVEQKPIDWTTLKLNTKVYVRNSLYDKWLPRHFKEYKDGKIYVFCLGRTSFTANGENDVTGYDYGMLAK